MIFRVSKELSIDVAGVKLDESNVNCNSRRSLAYMLVMVKDSIDAAEINLNKDSFDSGIFKN
jgi:hypothetical protein